MPSRSWLITVSTSQTHTSPRRRTAAVTPSRRSTPTSASLARGSSRFDQDESCVDNTASSRGIRARRSCCADAPPDSRHAARSTCGTPAARDSCRISAGIEEQTSTRMTTQPPVDLDAILAEVRARVRRKRESGEYGADLDAALTLPLPGGRPIFSEELKDPFQALPE